MVSLDKIERRTKKRSYGKGKAGKVARLKDAETTNRSALVRIYIEGGAPGNNNVRFFRQAWSKFLRSLDTVAKENGFGGITIIQGGGRYNAHDQFKNGAFTGEYDLRILLLDSEIPGVPLVNLWNTLLAPACGGYTCPSWATDDNLYLMVPTVEAWLMTDHDALADYYRRNFDRSKLLPSNPFLEGKIKTDLDASLSAASQHTQKGVYSHGEGNKIIEFIRQDIVTRLPHAERLFQHLATVIATNNPYLKRI
ncbi:hypothetical protein ACINK0_02615 [Deinococcus sp. VB343]|uniref:hypothetical protein n=1 Tax=Deinococcus sp. VB343 TaxID=3385567 RepID=UPI0039C92A89